VLKKVTSWKKLVKLHMYCSHGKQLKPLNVCFLVDGSLKMFCSFFSQVSNVAFKDQGVVFETLH
jgi:hypothetical protein